MTAILSIMTVLGVVVFTVILIFIIAPIGMVRPFGKWAYRIEHFWAGTICRVLRMRVKVDGLNNLDPLKNYIFVCNHQSLMDIPVMMRYTPRQLRIIYKRELNWIPLFGQILVIMRFISIDRGNRERAARSLRKAAQTIHDGVNLVIFADGTRSLDGNLKPLKKGAFILAIDSQVEIVPVAISGTINIIHKYESVLDLKFGKEIQVSYGAPISTSDFGPQDRDKLKNRVEEALGKMFEPHRELSRISNPFLIEKIKKSAKSTRNGRAIVENDLESVE